MALTVKDLMERMPGALIPTCTAEPGIYEEPNLSLTAEAADYIDMITGKLNPMTAIATKKVVLKGDLNLAMKYMNLFAL